VHVDREDFVTLLNADLQTEYQSIVQYVQHISIVKGAEYLSAIDELRAHLAQELQHALVLAEQVDFLAASRAPRYRRSLQHQGRKKLCSSTSNSRPVSSSVTVSVSSKRVSWV
jgi:bacterioferritin (cytochrome b1)